MRRSWGLLLAGAIAAGGLSLPAGAQADADSPRNAGATKPVQIGVGTKQIAGKVPSEIVGGNHRWPKFGLGMWDPKANGGRGGPVGEIEGLSKRTGLGAVRYPGGTVAGLFNWKNAVDDPAHPDRKRGCQVGGGFVGEQGATLDSAYGPDENQRYVEAVGAKTTMMLNSTTQSVRSAEDFVEYMVAKAGENPNGGKDWALVRDANKRADGLPPGPYDIQKWEIGNEPWLENQSYWRQWKKGDPTRNLHQYAGLIRTQLQTDQPVGTPCNKKADGGRGTGKANQRFQVWYPPVQPKTGVTLTVGEDKEKWTPTDDLDSVGRDAKRFELNRKTGTVRFGDGEHGMIPPRGKQIRATYMSGPHPGYIQFHEALTKLDAKMDANISVCSSWEDPDFVRLMAKKKQPFDCVAPHLYVHPDLSGTDWPEVYDGIISSVSDENVELRQLNKAIDGAMRAGYLRKRPFLMVSEYGQIAKGRDSSPEFEHYGATVSNNAMLGSMLVTMMEQGVRTAEISNLNNGQDGHAGDLFGGPPFLSTGRAEMLKLASNLVGSTPVQTRITDNPKTHGYRALRVVTTRAPNGSLRLFVVNRARDTAVPSAVDLPGTVPGAGKATVTTLNGKGLKSYNSPDHPDAVKATSKPKSWSGGKLAHRFPAHSITLIEIPKG